MAERMGSDVEGLDRLARRFETEGGGLQHLMSSITAELDGVWWRGRDAEEFKTRWESELAMSLLNVSDVLSEAAVTLRMQAHEQRQISQL